MNEKILLNYTDSDLIHYFQKTYGILKIRQRHYLDKRNYVIGILYHKFNYSEQAIAEIFGVDRSTVCQSKHKAHDCIYIIKDEAFMRNTRELRDKFSFNFMKKTSLWKSDFDTLVMTDFDPDYYFELNKLAKQHMISESDVAKKLLYKTIDELNEKNHVRVL